MAKHGYRHAQNVRLCDLGGCWNRWPCSVHLPLSAASPEFLKLSETDQAILRTADHAPPECSAVDPPEAVRQVALPPWTPSASWMHHPADLSNNRLECWSRNGRIRVVNRDSGRDRGRDRGAGFCCYEAYLVVETLHCTTLAQAMAAVLAGGGFERSEAQARKIVEMCG